MAQAIIKSCSILATGIFIGYQFRDIHRDNILNVTATTTIGPRIFPLRIPQISLPEGIGVKQNRNFIVGYNRKTRNPDWVLEFLTKELIGEPGDKKDYRRNLDFEFDETEPPLFRALSLDYRNSGYDRGHMAAAANYKNDELDCRRSFVLTNVCPQVGKDFNRGIWNNLEMFVRALVRRSEYVYVMTGPLYLPRQIGDKKYVQYEVIGPGDVAVPTHFYKIVLIKPINSPYFRLLSYVLPNQPIPSDSNDLTRFYAPIETIERAAGFQMFSSLKTVLTFTQINDTKL